MNLWDSCVILVLENMMINSGILVKIKRLHPDARIPQYSLNGDAAVDLIATEITFLKESNQIVVGTGLSIEIPEGYVGMLHPRSSISNTRYSLCNSTGIIDSNYRGELILKFDIVRQGRDYTIGDKIGQLIILPYPTINFVEVTDLSSTERGSNGFGSTGN